MGEAPDESVAPIRQKKKAGPKLIQHITLNAHPGGSDGPLCHMQLLGPTAPE